MQEAPKRLKQGGSRTSVNRFQIFFLKTLEIYSIRNAAGINKALANCCTGRVSKSLCGDNRDVLSAL